MAYVFRQGDLPKLDLQVDRGTDFEAWKLQWQAYFSLSGLDKEAGEKQVQAFTLCFSKGTLTVVENLGLTDNQCASATAVITAIEAYVSGQCQGPGLTADCLYECVHVGHLITCIMLYPLMSCSCL